MERGDPAAGATRQPGNAMPTLGLTADGRTPCAPAGAVPSCIELSHCEGARRVLLPGMLAAVGPRPTRVRPSPCSAWRGEGVRSRFGKGTGHPGPDKPAVPISLKGEDARYRLAVQRTVDVEDIHVERVDVQ